MPEGGPALLEARGLTLAAAGVPLRNGVTFVLAPGERLAVSGPSGSGKTTLLRAVAGLDDLPAGEVRLRDRTPHEWGWAAFRRRVSLVAQRPTFWGGTIEENLRRPFAYHASGGAPFPEARARELLARLGLAPERWTQGAATLSVGQQQRVSLVRALLLDADALLLDEPTSALDQEAAAEVEAVLHEEGERRGLAALVVTHDFRQAEVWCHRRLDLRDFPTPARGSG